MMHKPAKRLIDCECKWADRWRCGRQQGHMICPCDCHRTLTAVEWKRFKGERVSKVLEELEEELRMEIGQ